MLNKTKWFIASVSVLLLPDDSGYDTQEEQHSLTNRSAIPFLSKPSIQQLEILNSKWIY